MGCDSCSANEVTVLRINAELQNKERQLAELSERFKVHKLQSKGKLAQLRQQFEAISCDAAEGSPESRLSVLVSKLDETECSLELSQNESISLRQQLKDSQDKLSDHLIKIKNLEEQVQSLQSTAQYRNSSNVVDPNPHVDTSHDVQKMYAQLVYKDSRMLEMNSVVLEKDRQIVDLQELCRERDEVLSAKTRAIHILNEQLQQAASRPETRDMYCETTMVIAALDPEPAPAPSIKSPGRAVPLLFARTGSPPPADPSGLDLYDDMSSITTEQSAQVEASFFLESGPQSSGAVPVRKKAKKKVTFDLTDQKINDLQEKIREHEVTIDELRVENDEFRSSLTEMEHIAELEAKEKEEWQLQAKLMQAQAEQVSNDLEISRKEKKAATLKAKAQNQSRVKDLEGELENILAELEDYKDKLFGAHKAEKQYLHDNQNLQDSIHKYRMECHELRDKVENLDLDCRALNEGLRNKERLVKKLEEKLEASEEAFMKTREAEQLWANSEQHTSDALRSQTLLCAQFEYDLAVLHAENDARIEEQKELRDQLVEAQTTADKLLEQKKQVLSDLDSLKEAMETSQQVIDYLQEQLDDTTQQLAELRCTKGEITKELMRETASQKLKGKALWTKLMQEQAEKTDLQNQLSEITKQLNLKSKAFDVKIKSSVVEKGLIEDQLMLARNRISDLEKKGTSSNESTPRKDSMEIEVKMLKKRLEEQNSELMSMKTGNRNLLDEKSEIEHELEELWTRETELKRVAGETDAINNRLREERDKLARNNQQLTIDEEKMSEQVAQLTNRKRELKQELSKMNDRVIVLETSATKETKNLADEMEKFQEHYRTVINEKAQLSQSLDSAVAHIETLRDDKKILQDDNFSLTSRLEESNNCLKLEREELNFNVNSWRDCSEKLQEQVNEDQNTLVNLRGDFAKANLKVSELENLVTAFREKFAAILSGFGQMKCEINAVVQSQTEIRKSADIDMAEMKQTIDSWIRNLASKIESQTYSNQKHSSAIISGLNSQVEILAEKLEAESLEKQSLGEELKACEEKCRLKETELVHLQTTYDQLVAELEHLRQRFEKYYASELTVDVERSFDADVDVQASPHIVDDSDYEVSIGTTKIETKQDSFDNGSDVLEHESIDELEMVHGESTDLNNMKKSALVAVCSSLEAKCRGLSEKVEKLTNDREALCAEIVQLNEQVEILQSENETLYNTRTEENIQENISNNIKEGNEGDKVCTVDDDDPTVSEYLHKISSLESDVQLLRHCLNEEHTQTQLISEERDQISTDFEELKTRFDVQEEVVEQFKTQVENLHVKLSQMHADHDNLSILRNEENTLNETTIQDLRNKLDELSQLVDYHKNEIEQLNLQLLDKGAENNSLLNMKDQAEGTAEKIKCDFDQQVSLVADLKSEIEALNSQLLEKTAENENLSKTRSEETIAYEKRLHDVNASLDEQVCLVRDHKNEIELLKFEIVEKDTESGALAQIKVEEAGAYEGTIHQLKQDVDSLTQNYNHVCQLYTALQQAYTDYYNEVCTSMQKPETTTIATETEPQESQEDKHELLRWKAKTKKITRDLDHQKEKTANDLTAVFQKVRNLKMDFLQLNDAVLHFKQDTVISMPESLQEVLSNFVQSETVRPLFELDDSSNAPVITDMNSAEKVLAKLWSLKQEHFVIANEMKNLKDFWGKETVRIMHVIIKYHQVKQERLLEAMLANMQDKQLTQFYREQSESLQQDLELALEQLAASKIAWRKLEEEKQKAVETKDQLIGNLEEEIGSMNSELVELKASGNLTSATVTAAFKQPETVEHLHALGTDNVTENIPIQLQNEAKATMEERSLNQNETVTIGDDLLLAFDVNNAMPAGLEFKSRLILVLGCIMDIINHHKPYSNPQYKDCIADVNTIDLDATTKLLEDMSPNLLAMKDNPYPNDVPDMSYRSATLEIVMLLEKKIIDLENNCQAIRYERNELESKIAMLELKYQGMQDSKLEMESTLLQLTQDLHATIDQANSKDSVCMALKTEISVLTDAIESKDNQVQQLQQDLNGLQELDAEQDKMKHVLAVNDAETLEAHSKIESLKIALDQKDKMMTDLEMNKAHLEKTIYVMDTTLNEVRTENGLLQESIHQWQKKCVDIQNEFCATDSKCRLANEDNQRLKEKMVSLQGYLNEVQTQKNLIQEETADLKSQLGLIGSSFEEKIISLTEENKNLSKQLEDSVISHNNLHSAWSQLNVEHSGLVQKCVEAGERIPEDVERKLNLQNEAICDIKEQVVALETVMEEKDAVLNQKADEIELLEGKLSSANLTNQEFDKQKQNWIQQERDLSDKLLSSDNQRLQVMQLLDCSEKNSKELTIQVQNLQDSNKILIDERRRLLQKFESFENMFANGNPLKCILELRGELNSLLDLHRNMCATMETDCSKVKGLVADAAERLHKKYEKKILEAKEEYTVINEERNNLTEQLCSCQQELADCQAAMDVQQPEMDILKVENSGMQAKLNELMQQLQDGLNVETEEGLHKEISELTEIVQKQTKEIDSLQESNSILIGEKQQILLRFEAIKQVFVNENPLKCVHELRGELNCLHDFHAKMCGSFKTDCATVTRVLTEAAGRLHEKQGKEIVAAQEKCTVMKKNVIQQADQLCSCQQELASAQAFVDALQPEIEILKEENSAMQEKLNELIHQRNNGLDVAAVDTLNGEVSRLNELLKTKTEDIEEKNGRILELQDTIAKCQTDLENERQNFLKKISEKEELCLGVQEQNCAISKDLDSKIEVIHQLQEDIAKNSKKLEAEMRRREEESIQWKENVERLREQKEKLEVELEHAISSQNVLHSKLGHMDLERSELVQKSAEESCKVRAELEKRLCEKDAEMQKLVDNIRTLQDQLVDKEKIANKECMETKLLKQELATAKAAVALLDKQSQESFAQATACKEEVKLVAKDRAKNVKLLTKAEKRVENLQTEVTALKDTICKNETQLAQLQDTVHVCGQARDDTLQQLGKLREVVACQERSIETLTYKLGEKEKDTYELDEKRVVQAQVKQQLDDMQQETVQLQETVMVMEQENKELLNRMQVMRDDSTRSTQLITDYAIRNQELLTDMAQIKEENGILKRELENKDDETILMQDSAPLLQQQEPSVASAAGSSLLPMYVRDLCRRVLPERSPILLRRRFGMANFRCANMSFFLFRIVVLLYLVFIHVLVIMCWLS